MTSSEPETQAPSTREACEHEWKHVANQFRSIDHSKKFPRIADVTHRIYRCKVCGNLKSVSVGA